VPHFAGDPRVEWSSRRERIQSEHVQKLTPYFRTVSLPVFQAIYALKLVSRDLVSPEGKVLLEQLIALRGGMPDGLREQW